jgi:glutaredoxin-related protein
MEWKVFIPAICREDKFYFHLWGGKAMSMKTVEQIESQIALLKKELSETKGTQTEVYTRIVGYHRAVDNWNKGKREEYKQRKVFNFRSEDMKEHTFITVSEKKGDVAFEKAKKLDIAPVNYEAIATYKLFTSEYCRNCPPVKEYINSLPILGEEIDVSTELGINISKEFDIMSTPTVVLFDKSGMEICRAYTVKELKDIFAKVKVENALLKN